MKLIFLGPPGAGKGTQAEKVIKDHGIVQLSTGDILRENRRNGTDLGKEAEVYMNAGDLVPDEVIINMIKQELQKPENSNGYLLDGFPRTVAQAEAFDALLNDINDKLDAVVILDVPEQELIGRLTARRTCSKCNKSYHLKFNPPKNDNVCDNDGAEIVQRKDDMPETVKNRLKVYNEQTKPLINYYTSKNIAHKIDGTGSLDDVHNRIKETLEKVRKKIFA